MNTEHSIIMQLANYGDHIRRYELMLPNVYTQHDNEADLFCVRKSGLADEFEVKVSRSDFLADKKKFICTRELTPAERPLYQPTLWEKRFEQPNYKPKYQALIDGDLATNYFWYAVDEGVAQVEDMPEFAGLIIAKHDGRLRIAKAPSLLHKSKLSIEDRYKLARKSAYRFWKLKNEIEETGERATA